MKRKLIEGMNQWFVAYEPKSIWMADKIQYWMRLKVEKRILLSLYVWVQVIDWNSSETIPTDDDLIVSSALFRRASNQVLDRCIVAVITAFVDFDSHLVRNAFNSRRKVHKKLFSFLFLTLSFFHSMSGLEILINLGFIAGVSKGFTQI